VANAFMSSPDKPEICLPCAGHPVHDFHVVAAGYPVMKKVVSIGGLLNSLVTKGMGLAMLLVYLAPSDGTRKAARLSPSKMVYIVASLNRSHQ
jgi:hypothetical protein